MLMSDVQVLRQQIEGHLEEQLVWQATMFIVMMVSAKPFVVARWLSVRFMLRRCVRF